MKKSTITVLLVKPYEAPQTVEIPAALSAYQELVGGTIQALYPSADDPVALICHDEGKLLGLPLNRPLFDEEGNLYDIIAGTFFVAGLSEDDFDSLSPELIQKYGELFGAVYLL